MKTLIPFLLTGFYLQAQVNQTVRFLDKNKVKAGILTTNDKFWDMYNSQNPLYEVPAGSQKHAMSANSLWIGGIDSTGLLRMAANTYKQIGVDLLPGPLDTSMYQTYNAANSAPYNTLWKVDCNDIKAFVNAFKSGEVAANTYTIPPDILNYPAKGTANFQKNMHPFADLNHDGLYNPQSHGDYPLIKGHQQILSIYNDVKSMHSETNSSPMGVEVHEHTFAYSEPFIHDTMQAINYTTFYQYTIYNRSPYSYHNVYVTDWADVDLGNWADDYIGADTVNHFAYCYNAGNSDPTSNGRFGYGNYPPVLSHAILPNDCSSDGIDNDNDGTIDESGEHFLMNRVTYYNDNLHTLPPQTTEPNMGIHYYNYMSGYWKDGSHLSYGGTAYGGTVATNFVYSGDPQSNSGWTETTAGNTPGNRRFLISSGPFNFPAGSRIEWGYAIVFSQDAVNQVNTISQFHSRVQRDVRNVKHYYLTHQSPQCAPDYVGLDEIAGGKLSAMIYPNPANRLLTVDLSENVTSATLQLFDMLGAKKAEGSIQQGYRTELDLSSLEDGVYFLKIRSEKGMLMRKIVKH